MRHRALQLILAVAALTGLLGAGFAILARSSGETAIDRSPVLGGAVTYAGINASGAEFAPQTIPGVAGKNFVYPKPGAIARYARLGANVVRLPVRWERVQAQLFAPLVAPEIARIDAAVAEAEASKVLLVLDLHNYARYRNRLIDSEVGAGMADLWTKLAKRYAGRDVAFGLMNEPHDIAASDWSREAERSVAAIRATGAGNLILVPGTSWTGAHSWQNGGPKSNAAAFASFDDRNFAFELHQYLDGNSSGTSFQCAADPDLGVRRLAAVTRWLRERHARGFLGEFAAGSSPACQEALAAMLRFMDDNSDVWLGWTYWTAGPWWPEKYEFGVEPSNDGWPVRATALRAAFAARLAAR
jgi:endoglucanase